MRRSQAPAPAFVALAALGLLLWPATAWADVGVPMLVLIWPASALLFIPVVLVEAWVARRLLAVDRRRAFNLAVITNAVSTLAGIPLTYLLTLIPSVLGSIYVVRMEHLGQRSQLSDLLNLATEIPWTFEGAPHGWEVGAALVLCIPFFFASVWIEGLVARRVEKQLPREQLRAWAWRANLVSYGGIIALLLAALAWELTHRPCR